MFSFHFQRACLVAPLVFSLVGLARADNIVVPGERVGSVKLGATLAQVHTLLGHPSKSLKWKSGETQDTFLGPKPPLNADKLDSYPRRTLTVIYRAGRVVQIEFNSPAFRTNKGISTNSSLLDFRRAYGPVKPRILAMLEGGGGYVAYYYDSTANGIAFSFGTQDYFDATIKPEAFRIHKRGTKVLPDPGGSRGGATDEVPIGTINHG